MVGGHEKQSDSNITSTSSSASASVVCADWDIAPPYQNVRVDTQYVGMIEEQKQQSIHLQEELAEFNHVWYRTSPANANRGKNVWGHQRRWVWPQQTDHINQQAVTSYVRETIWPGNKMIPKSWSKWRDDKRSLCQMIIKKVALPLGVNGKSTGRQWYQESQTTSSAHWGHNSSKSCLSSFKVRFVTYKHGNGSVIQMK
jgi:hypothetical protein